MKTREILMYILGGLIVIGFFSLLLFLVKIAIPAENKDLLNIAIGSLIAAFATVVGYFYGSSKGSADKNDLLNQKPDQAKPDQAGQIQQ